MDDGVADVAVECGAFDGLSLPERLLLAEMEKDGGKTVERLLRQVHYCWPESEN